MRKEYFLFLFGIFILIISGLWFSINKNKNFPAKNESVLPENSSKNILNESTQTPMIKKYQIPPSTLATEEIKNKRARIKTSKGEIILELFAEVPKTASNFIFLSKDGFYDGLTFHRREEGFVIQGGDPNGNGTGGPGYKFEDELVTKDYTRGIVAMANSGPNTNGSQFFIMLADNPLPKLYTIFGKVIEGMDVADKISVGDVMEKVTIE